MLVGIPQKNPLKIKKNNKIFDGNSGNSVDEISGWIEPMDSFHSNTDQKSLKMF